MNFNERLYLEANPDVADAVSAGQIASGLDHWITFGQQENRLLHKVDSRVEKVFYTLKKSGLGLEIGPSHNPLAPKKDGHNVHILDHADANTLRKKYKTHGVNLENIEEVDFVWNGQPLTRLIGKENCYDWIIASHVIEHVPDFVTFLQECQSLLKPNGVISLVVPDKRFCFDYHSPITTTGELLDAYELKRKKPSPGKVFDHFANASALNGQIAWDESAKGEVTMIHSLSQAVTAYESAKKNSEYIDVHCWRFVPSSFEMIIQDLNTLGLISLNYFVSFDTVGCEFYVSLVKTESITHEITHLNQLNNIRKELSIFRDN